MTYPLESSLELTSLREIHLEGSNLLSQVTFTRPLEFTFVTLALVQITQVT